MNSVDFLSQDYRCEPVKKDKLLGICDPVGEVPAYTTNTKSEDKWCATIENEESIDMQFVPIDKNIPLLRPNGERESTCDGMLLYGSNISFVELKDVRIGGWLSEAISQLSTTVEIFNANHDYRQFGKRRAYAANACHPNFQSSCRERLQEFRSKFHFTLMPQAKIIID